jgi:peptide/nickel transport system substrate-binding protein
MAEGGLPSHGPLREAKVNSGRKFQKDFQKKEGEMSGKKIKIAAALAAMVVVLSACATATPEVIEKVITKEIEKVVTQIVKETVKETVIVEGTPQVVEKEVTKIVEEVVVVTATPEPEAGPVEGGWLTVAFLSTIQDTGDMHRSNSSHSAFLAGHALDTLIRKNPADGSYHPGLAESWEVADDGTSITFYLRDDVTFHDGTPFNAQAVLYNHERIATHPDTKGRSAYTGLSVGNLYDKTEVIDDYTVKVSFTKPYARIVDVFSTNQTGSVASPTAMEEYGDEYGTEAIVGTGPFKFVEWTGPLGEIKFERNEDYNWASPIYKHQGPPYLDGFTVLGILEPGTRTSILEDGSADLVYLLEKDYANYKDRPGYSTMLVAKQGSSRQLVFDLTRPFLKDSRVRQAICHAIDREGLVDSTHFGGVARVALTPISAATWGASTEEFREYNYLYDLDKGKALLEEAGWKDEDGDGIREAHGVEGVEDGTKLHIVESVNANVAEESELLQGMLTELGLEHELQVHDFTAYRALCIEGNCDFNVQSTSGSHFWLLEEWFHSRGIEGGNNLARYSNPEVDALWDELDVTIDAAKQRELFAQIQKTVLEDAVVCPAWDMIYAWAMHEGVNDVTTDAAAIGVYLYDTWINPNP